MNKHNHIWTRIIFDLVILSYWQILVYFFFIQLMCMLIFLKTQLHVSFCHNLFTTRHYCITFLKRSTLHYDERNSVYLKDVKSFSQKEKLITRLHLSQTATTAVATFHWEPLQSLLQT